jgi:hypothetical protein
VSLCELAKVLRMGAVLAPLQLAIGDRGDSHALGHAVRAEAERHDGMAA